MKENILKNKNYKYLIISRLNAKRRNLTNEDELFATTKNIFTLEYRFLLDKNSHIFLFADQTWYENISNKYYNDTPIGFGLGFAFSTNLGTFSISYALGQQLGNQILLSDSKIHFGYIAYF